MNSMELPLVGFTVITQTAIGLVILSSVRQLALAGGSAGKVRAEWIAAALLLMAGLTASLAHLGHPDGALRAVLHVSRSWLSREVIGVGLLFVLVVAGAVSARTRTKPLLAGLAVGAGLGTLYFTGMTYAPPSYPAVNNALPFVFFLLTGCILGSALAVYFASAEGKALMTRILAVSLIVALVIYLLVPCIWLSGGPVMAMTGKAWMTSDLYWLRIGLGLVLPLAVLAFMRRMPLWLPLFMVAGEVLGRIVFFSETVHSAANMGGLY